MNSLARIYDEQAPTYNQLNLAGPSEASAIMVLLMIPVNTEISMLDIGCGAGMLLTHVREEYPGSFVGVDFSDAMLHEAGQYAVQKLGENHGIRFVKQDLHELDASSSDWKRILQRYTSEGQGFDFITCTHVLEHFDEPSTVRLLRQLERLLRPGGKLLVQRARLPKILDGFYWGVSSQHGHATDPRLNGMDQFAPSSFRRQAVRQLRDLVSTATTTLKELSVMFGTEISDEFSRLHYAPWGSCRMSLQHPEMEWVTDMHNRIANGMRATDWTVTPANNGVRVTPEEYARRLEQGVPDSESYSNQVFIACSDEMRDYAARRIERNPLNMPYDKYTERLGILKVYVDAYGIFEKATTAA